MKENEVRIQYAEDLVNEVKADFEARRNARKALEAKWLVNLNFMLGNQYCVAGKRGGITELSKHFDWEQREVFNHITPIIESRLSKFARVNCLVNVRPQSGSDRDIDVAKLASCLIEGAEADNNFVALTSVANYWSEVTGTSFYKVVWNARGGKTQGVGGRKHVL